VPTDRLTKEEYGILLALAASERSEDPHTKVGAVIVNRFNEILATGYNGLKSGQSLNPSLSRDDKRKHMIHAEQNALRFVKNGDNPHTIYTSLSPCLSCAQAIMANNIKRVIYAKEYGRDTSFKEIFDIYGVEYYQVHPSMCKNITKSLQNLLSYLH
tara:strand:- start:483 stop:953 length:471 start_codon:yes stop_codon:yes gene_type:complete